MNVACFVAMCVDTCRFATGCCETHCNSGMNVAWALFWGGGGARNLVFFRVKWLQPAMKGTSCVLWLQLDLVNSIGVAASRLRQ